MAGCETKKGDTIYSYVPPHPTRGTGFHRYIFIVLEQSAQLDTAQLRDRFMQGEYGVKIVLEKMAHEGLLMLRGLTFHRASWTPFVSEMYKESRIKTFPTILQSNLYTPATTTINSFDVNSSDANSNTVMGSEEDANSNQSVDEEGRVVMSKEPIYGKTVDRDWHSVTQRLYKYAFK